MNRCVTLVLALALAGTLGPAPARADVVTLANGDRLSGKIEHLSGEALTLETTYAGKVKIRRDEIATLETDAPVALLLEGEPQPAMARLAGAPKGRVAFAPAPRGERREMALARVLYINPSAQESGIGVAYKGRVSLSAAQVRGNSSSSRNYGEAELTARAKDYRYTLGFKGTRAEDSGRKIASNWIADGTYDRFVASDRFYYGRGSFEQDRFRGIDMRSTVGGGYGLQLFDTDHTQISLRGGLDFVMLERTGGVRDSHPALGWGLRVSHWIWQRRAELFHDHDGFWNVSDTEQVTVRSRTGLRVPIAKGLTASAQVNLNWERQPAPGRKPTDTTLLLGLGYEW